MFLVLTYSPYNRIQGNLFELNIAYVSVFQEILSSRLFSRFTSKPLSDSSKNILFELKIIKPFELQPQPLIRPI